MAKATHNGTCQACGREQAVTPNGLAKHGYTTRWGFFSGTCPGSDRQPLELETAFNLETVDKIRSWADQQEQFSNGNIETVVVQVRDNDDPRRFATKDITVNREQYLDLKRKNGNTEFDDLYNDDFDRKIDVVRADLRRNAEFARKDARLLEELREKRHGKNLISREVEESRLVREYFKRPRDGYARQAELKEQGIKSRVTGRNPSITLTYRK